jgi:hypothetical protein
MFRDSFGTDAFAQIQAFELASGFDLTAPVTKKPVPWLL